MKKVMIFVLLIFLISGAFAKSGVTPSSYVVNFEPGLERDFKFRFIFSDGVESKISLAGDLREYASVNKEKIRGEEEVVVHLELPDEIEKPGTHIIRVGAKGKLTGEGGFALSADVGGIIKVVVPYPGKYVETSLKATRANAGENISLDFDVQSKGDESVGINAYLEIRDAEKLVDTIEFGAVSLSKGEVKKYNVNLNTDDYEPGDYIVKGIVLYDGKVAESETLMRLGHLFVDIMNYTREVSRGEIVSYGIDIESFWNNEIDDVFATGRISGTDIDFKTPSADLRGWEKTHLNGFFDTTGLEGEFAKMILTLHYEGEITQKVVRVKLVDNVDWLLVSVVGILVIIVLSLVGIVIYLWRKKKR